MPSEEGKQVLRLLAEKKIDAEQAYRLLAALGDLPGERPTQPGGPRGQEGPQAPGWARGMGARTLRIRVTEGGRQKVNVAIPLGLARLGRIGGFADKMAHQFGIDLREIVRDVQSAGKVIDVVGDSGDRVEIYVE